MLRRFILAALLALVAAPALAAPHTVYVVRHFDTPQGEKDPDLSATGKARAASLARWFQGKPVTAIYISDFKRTRQTAGVLAAARGLTPILYDPADPAALLAKVRAAAGPVLIVGHSNTVPDLVLARGGARPGDLTHPDFGDIWTVVVETAHGRIEP